MKSTQRIALLLALVFLLPALFFSVYELSSLNKDEKMIQDIYGKQLEAILFSVNQYSDDILGNWTSRIETGLAEAEPGMMPVKIKSLLELNACLMGFMLIDSAESREQVQMFSLQGVDDRFLENALKEIRRDTATTNQLFRYKRSGFQKITRVNVPGDSTENHCLIYVTQNTWGQRRLAGLIIDAELFVQDIIGPRLQEVAKDQFILSAFKKGNQTPVYSTLTPAQQWGEQTAQAEAATKEIWIFPEYVLGIRVKGESLQELVRERTSTNLLLLGALDVILITAVVLVFRNLKKEVDLAQNKADFVSNVSHEIRTPLALISMFAETLELNRVASEEKKHEYYRIISKEAQRLTGIVNKILNFSQAEAKKKMLHIDVVDMNRELRNILETYDFHLRNKGFDYGSAPEGELWVKADRDALTEVIINLIDNAVKYSEDTKRIEFESGISNGLGFLAIRDFGVGISAADKKHIFDKFYRVHKGNLARSRGTGLGLALVKQLMDEQKGKITVQSELGKGSTFTIFLPLE